MPINPNLVIAGVNKAGTTSLFSYLAKHPQVCGSSIKETCYFLPIRYGDNLAPISEYQSLFQYDRLCSVYMEATPGYFYGEIALIEKIKCALPGVRIVILLRDPASRLISFFNFMKSMLFIDRDMTLESYINHCRSLSSDELKCKDNNPYFGVEGGYYNCYIGDWIERFGEGVKILFFEDMKDNPSAFLSELCEWINIDPCFYTDFDFEIENKTSSYRNKGVHRLALMINNQLETILRRYPIIKRILRSVYSRFNTGTSIAVSQDDSEMARGLYSESNKELAKILKESGHTNLPYWLKVK